MTARILIARRRTAAVALLLPALLALAGCARETRVERRLLLVGIDAADWGVIEPLAAEGKLPNLTSLMVSGVWCDLRSLEPKQKSPTIWASIATGKLPEKHGILDYVDAGSKKLVTSNMRKTKAFWDILGDHGRTVSVVGWLTSWPAQQVNGVLVSDYFQYEPREGKPLPEHTTYPDALASEIDSLRIAPEAVSDEDIARFADVAGAVSAADLARLPVPERLDEMRAKGDLPFMLEALRNAIAGDRTSLGVTEHLMRAHPTDVVAVYLRGVDTASHKFWPAAHPRQGGFPVSRTESRVFGTTVERYYMRADEMLGRLLRAFGEGATVIVCSDHGFEGPKRGQEIGGINEHGPVGILIMAGEGIRRGVRIDDQDVCDVAPTILALYGLPVGDDMDGEVIGAALTEEFLAAHPTKTVPSHEPEE